MRILFLKWNGFGERYIEDEFKKAGCEVETADWPFGTEAMRENTKLVDSLIKKIRSKNFHFVFSLNFFPVASEAAYRCGTKYVSWIYDSPYLLLYSEKIKYVTNQIYFFDKSLWKEFKEKGIENIYYMPMAAPVEYYDTLKPEENGFDYKAEISFVGSTYREERQNFYKYLENVKPYVKGYLEAVMNAQKNIYGSFVLEELLSENILNELRRVCPIEKGDDEWETDAWIYANYFLARELTGRQRVELLDLLSEKHEVTLYTNEKVSELQKAKVCGVVDYETEMPLVFKNTKINLNITLRSIHSGIPLRAMDIMGCGGFLLTNYQEDFLEYFEPGVDYVYYVDNQDLLEKVEYYLTHDEERATIARNGYMKVREGHSYHQRVAMVLQQIMDDEEEKFNDLMIELEKVRESQGGRWNIKYPQLITEQELCELGNLKRIYADNEKQPTFQLHDQMLKLIDRALQEGGERNYELIISYFYKNTANGLQYMFSDLAYVIAFMRIFLLERQNKKNYYSVSRFTSHEQLQKCFMQLVFYLRRIERDLPIELQMEIVPYLQKSGLSDIAIKHILQESRVGTNEEKVEMQLFEVMKAYLEKVKESI